MKHFSVYTTKHGEHEVVAQTARHAVAAVVARIGLTEQETACVVKWSVVKNKEEKQTRRREMSKENNVENVDSLREALVVLAVNYMRAYISELKEASDEKDPEKTEYLLREDSIETIAALAYVGSKEFVEMMKTRLGVDVGSKDMERRTEEAGRRFAHAMAFADVIADAVEKFHHENSKDKE